MVTDEDNDKRMTGQAIGMAEMGQRYMIHEQMHDIMLAK